MQPLFVKNVAVMTSDWIRAGAGKAEKRKARLPVAMSSLSLDLKLLAMTWMRIRFHHTKAAHKNVPLYGGV